MAEIKKYIQMLVNSKASDIHLTTGCPPYLRIHGKITSARVESLTAQTIYQLIEEIAPAENKKQFDEIHDTDFAYEIPGEARVRVNVFLDHNGPGIVMRMIPYEIMTAEQLNLPKAVIDMCALNKGLVVVTGPTGSGKTTTLAAMVDYINRIRTDHIITVEDPIEFLHKNKKCLINQRETQTHTVSFQNALRAALREDPDVVMIGEMRDLETIEIALETAETGHLVLGTLHTTTAASTVERIIEQFPGERQNQVRQMLSNSLKGVVAQTLLPRKDNKGRIAAMEILVITPAIANQIREGKTYQIPSAMQTGMKHGMVLLNDVLLRLVLKNLITPEDAYLKSVEKSDLLTKFSSENIVVNLQTDIIRNDTPTMVAPRPGGGMVPRSPKIIHQRTTTMDFVPQPQKTRVPATDDFEAFRQKMFNKKR